ncbi:MAG: glycosyltransferase family 4 protein [Prevotella sp.]|nr:glycosyltransferase family 4 protein [Prevotella sp.]
MKLIYFIPLLSTVGGQERTLTDKAAYLTSRGHDVMFVTYEHEGPLAYKLYEKVKHVDLHCHFFTLYRYPVVMRVWKALQLKRLFRRRFKKVVSQFSPDVIVIAVPNTENFICDVARVSGNIPIVVESHLAQGCQVIKRGITEKWLYLFYKPLRAIRRSSLLVALTKGDATSWSQKGIKNIEVIPNPVTHYEPFLNNCEKVEGRILCAGRLTPQKRFDRLIDAFSMIAERYPAWHVVILGEGEDKETLKRQIVERGMVDRIVIKPPTHDIYTEYIKSQFFVLCSDFEGFGLVIVEAMACGTPVIATDCPFGPSEIIEDGVTGLLAKMDTMDLARKMEWMITHDVERKTMGKEAHKAVARYRKEIVMPQWEQAYLSVIQ